MVTEKSCNLLEYHSIKEVETAQPVQMNIYQNNINRKDLGLLRLDNEARFQRNY